MLDKKNLDLSQEYELVLALSGEDFYDQESHDISDQDGNQTYESSFQAPSGNYTALAILYQGDDQVAYRERSATIEGNATIVLDPIDLSGMFNADVRVCGISSVDGANWVDIVVLDTDDRFYTGYGEEPGGDDIRHEFALPAGTYHLQAIVWSDGNFTSWNCERDVNTTGSYSINCGGGE